MQFYHEEKNFCLLGIDREDFISRMMEWSNDDQATHYMVTGLYPGNREQIGKTYDDLIKGDNVVFSIISKQSGKTIGFAGLYDIRWQPRFAEFRIIIGDRKFHGKGIGTRAAQFIVSYAFRSLNLNKVWLGVNAENKSAVKSYQKAGFKQEGVLRQEVWRNNRYYDAIRMSVLSKDHGS